MADSTLAYETYRQSPDPDKLTAVVHALKPTIDYTLNSLQSHHDPVMRSKAHSLAAQAIQRFDPTNGAQLHTWVSSQLLPLRRFRRQSQSVVKIPERVQLDGFTLFKAEQDFRDKFNRDPDLRELADHSNIPVKRIEIIRNTMKSTPSEAGIGDSAPPEETDFAPEAMDFVHHDADHIDRRILELKTGYGGTEMMSPKLIAQHLNITPTNLTRRSQRLGWKIQEIERQLQKLQ